MLVKTLFTHLCLRITLCLLITLVWVSHGICEPTIEYFAFKTPFRFDHQSLNNSGITKSSRYQLQISADVEVSLTGHRERGLKVVTLIGSGENFTSQWSTLYDRESDEQKPLEISMRQLYLHYLGEFGHLSAGVIPPVKDLVSNTSMDSDGWIRGGRVVIYLGEDGELEGVTGAIDRLNQPSVFQTPTRWNYHEVEWTQGWIRDFRTELGVMLLKRAKITRGEVRYGLTGPWNAHYELSGEFLFDVKGKRHAYDMMLEIKKSDYRLRLEYSEINERFGLLGRLVNDFFSLGTVKMIALDGPIPWGGLKWFTRVYHSELVSRGMLGVSYQLEITR